MRPDNTAQWFLCFTGLSCCASSNRLFRYRDESKVHISDEQFYIAGVNNCTALQMSLADRNLFQMGQAIPANQNIFWYYRERSEDSNLDCHQRLCFGGDCQEGTENRDEFERNPAPTLASQEAVGVLFEKVPITQVLTKNVLQNEISQFHNQLLLFNL
jgi:hypothetical protein